MTGDFCKTPGCRNVVSYRLYCQKCKYARSKLSKDRELLKAGGPAVVHKSSRPLMTDADQMEIDRRCVEIDNKRGLTLAPPRSLSRREIAELERQAAITPVNLIPFLHDRFANILTGLVSM